MVKLAICASIILSVILSKKNSFNENDRGQISFTYGEEWWDLENL